MLKTLHTSKIETPVGTLLAIANNSHLLFLSFVEETNLATKVEKLRIQTQSEIISGINEPLASIENELRLYFKGNLNEFKTPIHFFGTPFQKSVWNALRNVPYGETRSYSEFSTSIGKKTAHRAVANANGANKIAIVIPCHRIVRRSGDLGGYAGGTARKKWLIHHEKNLL